jgi:hypothetical protein
MMSVVHTPEKGRMLSVRSGAWLGSLLFAPGQHQNHVRLALVDTLADLRKHVKEWRGRREPMSTVACCCWDHDSRGPDHGFVMLAREQLSRAILVHELTHAGLLFVNQHVMASEAVLKMSECAQGDYYHEACAEVIEKLYTQAEALLWPNRH